MAVSQYKPEGTITIQPQRLSIVWGKDPLYWKIDENQGTAELLQVCWLEVTGSVTGEQFKKGKKYRLIFNLELKPDAFGWKECPVYFMVKPGKSQNRVWKKCDLSTQRPTDSCLQFQAPAEDDDKVTFGLYEIWKGRWKGGLIIHDVVLQPTD